LALWLLLVAAPGYAQVGLPAGLLEGLAGDGAAGSLRVRAIASHTQVKGGQEFLIGLEVSIAEGWVYYSPDPGPIVLGARLDVSAGDWIVGEPLWPPDEPETVSIGAETIVNNVYTGKALVYVPIRVPRTARPGKHTIRLAPGGQICEKVCIDIEGVSASVTVSVGSSAVANPQWSGRIAAGLAAAMTAEQLKASHVEAAAGPVATRYFGAGAAMAVWAGLGLALLAGLTLNIMPCVLPVIPLRILSIVEMARKSRRRFVTLGLAFAGGIMLFFVGLAVVSALLRAATGQAVNISDHFQYPAVRIALAMVLVALTANLFGVFHVIVPSRLAALAGESRGQGHVRSLGMGLMMAVLATPCSFAFLFAAMAWAQLQPLWLGTFAILLVGVGMAAPHAILCAFPGLLEKLPRPGRWMELFKQAMGFLLLCVVIWLISTLSEDAWPFWVAAYGAVLAFALWMWANWVRHDASLVRKVVIRGLAAAIAVGAGLWMLPEPDAPADGFESFDESLIAAGRAQGRIVLVKVTASWCTECRVIEHRVYKSPQIARELTARNVLAIKADVTNRGNPASKWLRKGFGGAPPMTIIYPPGDRPAILLPGGFSPADLIRALDAAAAGES